MLLSIRKKHRAEKLIYHELQHHFLHMLDITELLDKRMFEIVAKPVTTLPGHNDDLANHPHKEIIKQLRRT